MMFSMFSNEHAYKILQIYSQRGQSISSLSLLQEVRAERRAAEDICFPTDPRTHAVFFTQQLVN